VSPHWARAATRKGLAAGLVVSEVASLGAAWLGRAGAAFTLHGLALPLAFALVLLCRPHGWSWRAAIAPALLAAALPGVGSFALLFVLLPAWQRPRSDANPTLLDIDTERALAPDLARSKTPRVIRDVLASSTLVSERLEAVLALRRLPAQYAVPILRIAFSDRNEDVRLLAFADLERRESKLRGRVKETSAALARGALLPPPGRAHLQRCLAQDHWELVYGGFVHGRLEARVLETAAGHAQASLELEPRGGATVLLARIALRQNRPTAAWRWLEEAERAGISQAVCAPLFAEAAYAQGHFSAVAPLLGRASLSQLRRPRLAPVADFWTGKGAS